MTRPRPPETVTRYLLLSLVAAGTLAPLVIVLLTAFQKPGAAVAGVEWPHHLNWQTFRSAWSAGQFASAFRASAIIAIAVVAIVTCASICVGYACATMRFPGSRALFYVFLSGMVVPYVVLVVPIYIEFRNVHLLDSYSGLILAESGLYLPFGVFWMHAFFVSVPRSLIDSGRLDGASSFRVLLQILLPIARPVIATLMMLTFVSSWNEYLVPLILDGDGRIQTVSLGLASFQGQHLTDVPSLSAAAIIVALPAVMIYLITQRSFFRGLLQGAIK
jgi:raffinose/stachyose/melibiose transport system permease protein